MKAAIHLDMVGGNPAVTKSVLHVTRSPWSAASFTDDVAETFARYVIDGAYEGAASGDFSRAVREPNGPKDALWADFTEYERGQRPLDLPGRQLRRPGHLPARLARHLHPHEQGRRGQRGPDQDQAVGVHRRRERLLPGDARPRPRRPTDAALPYLVLGGAMRRLGDAVHRASIHAFSKSGVAARGGRRGLGEHPPRGAAAGVTAQFDYAPAGSPGRRDAGRGRWATSRRMFPTGPPAPAGTADARVPARNPAVKGPLTPSVDWVRDKAGAAADGAGHQPGAATATTSRTRSRTSRTASGRSSEIRDAVSAEFGPVDTQGRGRVAGPAREDRGNRLEVRTKNWKREPGTRDRSLMKRGQSCPLHTDSISSRWAGRPGRLSWSC